MASIIPAIAGRQAWAAPPAPVESGTTPTTDSETPTAPSLPDDPPAPPAPPAAVAAPPPAGATSATVAPQPGDPKAPGDGVGGGENSATAQPPPTPPRRMVASLSHDLQLGVAVMLGAGYRGIIPYQSQIECGDAKATDSRVCTRRAPSFVDVQPSFGISDSWDFLVDLRFGIERDFNTHYQVYVMPGFRYWTDSQRRVKFFTTIQLAYDRSKQNSPVDAPHRVGDNDLGFRNSNGLMVEVMRNFGVYVQFGETVGFYRWLSFLVDGGIGLQARVP